MGNGVWIDFRIFSDILSSWRLNPHSSALFRRIRRMTGDIEIMAFMEWKEEYSVENDFFDDQHKNLIRTINQIYDDMDKGNDEEAKKIVKDLYIYTQHHIITEERKMRIKDKDFTSHCDDHDKILAT
ncbi:MAG TPA: hypothetical protein VHN12_00315, partial [Geobacteraceae bacterium]|nr:hypothetical protein [Geobacteraceae bacterium]